MGRSAQSPPNSMAQSRGIAGLPTTPETTGYLLDRLFRTDPPNPNRNNALARAEAELILANAVRQKNLLPEDRIYLARLVASQTGLRESDAENQVSIVFLRLQQVTETARSTIARSSLWLFIALLIGAFCASFAATLGGRERDRVQPA